MNDTVDSEAETEDPEYNFLAEAEQEDVDDEDFRNDRATKVSSLYTVALVGYSGPSLSAHSPWGPPNLM